jgi:hypothetical protein
LAAEKEIAVSPAPTFDVLSFPRKREYSGACGVAGARPNEPSSLGESRGRQTVACLTGPKSIQNGTLTTKTQRQKQLKRLN